MSSFDWLFFYPCFLINKLKVTNNIFKKVLLFQSSCWVEFNVQLRTSCKVWNNMVDPWHHSELWKCKLGTGKKRKENRLWFSNNYILIKSKIDSPSPTLFWYILFETVWVDPFGPNLIPYSSRAPQPGWNWWWRFRNLQPKQGNFCRS